MHVIDGRFTLQGKIGEGSYGIAYLAHDAHSGRRVVVKVLRERGRRAELARARFQREVAALRRIAHPHAVGLIATEVWDATGQPYYAMPFVEGVALDKILAREGAFPLPRALRLVDQILDALEHVHAQGVIHRDLKPANFLVELPGTPNEWLRVLDFGLAKHRVPSPEQGPLADLTGDSAVGTPLYMAPEQCVGEEVAPESDIYSLGCILMELLSGRPPFASETPHGLLAQHVMEPPPRLSERFPEAPHTLVEAVAACLEKEPRERPSARELREMLRKIAAQPERRPTEAVAVEARRGDRLAPLPADAPVRLEEGGQIGGYHLEKLLGKGGAGAVFRVRLPDGRYAALKALLPTAANDPAQTRRRFARELRLLKSLDHPNIPDVYDYGTQGGVDYGLIEFIPGEDLGERLEERGPLPAAELLDILRQVAPTLDYAHSRGIVHCDLKPANIRMHEDGRAFVIDLGISKLRAGSELDDGQRLDTREGLILGTFEYLPPEFAHGRKDVTPAADVYSLGVMLFELLSGRLPYVHDGALELVRLHVQAPIPDLRSVAPQVPPALAEAVRICMAKHPRERFPTAGLLLQRLEELAGDLAAVPTGAAQGVSAPTPEVGAQLDAQEDATLAMGVLSGQQAGSLYVLGSEPAAWSLGSQPQSSLAFPDERFDVSPQHALVELSRAGLFIRDLGSAEGTFVEGARVGAHGLPLARGALIRLGDPGLFLTVGSLGDLQTYEAPVRALRRLDQPGDHELQGSIVLGSGPESALPLGEAGLAPSHCRIEPRLGRWVVEDLAGRGTFVNGRAIQLDLLTNGDELALGGPQGPRFRVEIPPPRPAAASPPATASVPAQLGVSTEPWPGDGEALRFTLEWEQEGRVWRRFVFAGTRLRFGRNRARGTQRENDLVLRAFPRSGEAPAATQARTRNISGHHGQLFATRDGLALQDDGSSFGTQLGGQPLRPSQPMALPGAFAFEVGGSVTLHGRSVLAGPQAAPGCAPGHPLGALRLERSPEARHHGYALLLREAYLGSGESDAVHIPAPGVLPQHARLSVEDGQLLVTALRADAPVALAAGPLAAGASSILPHGTEFFLGAIRVRVKLTEDAEMKP